MMSAREATSWRISKSEAGSSLSRSRSRAAIGQRRSECPNACPIGLRGGEQMPGPGLGLIGEDKIPEVPDVLPHQRRRPYGEEDAPPLRANVRTADERAAAFTVAPF